MSHYARLADLCNCSCRDPYAVNKETRGVCNELHSCARERVLSQTPWEPTITDCSRGTRTHITHRNRTWAELLPVWEPTSLQRFQISLESPPALSFTAKRQDITLRSRERTTRRINTGKKKNNYILIKSQNKKKTRIRTESKLNLETQTTKLEQKNQNNNKK